MIYWYKFRKLMQGKDAVQYKYYEHKPSDAELHDAYEVFSQANPGPMLLVAYPQIEDIDTPPADYINRQLADAELRRAGAEHEVNIYRSELHYQQTTKEMD